MRRGYTLIEILISVSLSLFLLLGVTHMFRAVGTSLTDTQATLNMTRNLHQVARTLRNDLENLTYSDPGTSITPLTRDRGYFQIIEGMNTPSTTNSGLTNTHVLSTMVARNPDTGNSDYTVGDVDDILMFTAKSSVDAPFRGLIAGDVAESTLAEIVYFVRGNTLYRRVLLILGTDVLLPTDSPFFATNDISVYSDGGVLKPNTLSTLERRENRFGHWTNPDRLEHPFPFPIYFTNSSADTRAWYYLRMPTLEECAHTNWYAGRPLSKQWSTPSTTSYGGTQLYNNAPTAPYWDFWENPNGWNVQDTQSGSIEDFVTKPTRHERAGEDIVLTNVLSFDVKVWNPYWVPLSGANATSLDYWAPPQYVDLGQDTMFNLQGDKPSVDYNWWTSPPSMPWGNGLNVNDVGPTENRFGFCSKGRYAITADGAQQVYTGSGSGSWTGPAMPCVYDTWTEQYEEDPKLAKDGPPAGGLGNGLNPSRKTDYDQWECPPPYTMPLKGIEITIRCFDPRSRNIKQIRIVKDF